MQNKFILLIASLILMISCTKKHDDFVQPASNNSVLLLKVDYTTNEFKGGTELFFSNSSSTFTITKQYKPPGDFGSIKLTYQEINETLFNGTIIWMGKGDMSFPQSLNTASQFESVTTKDIIYPAAGYLDVFNPNNQIYDYKKVWLSVQQLVKVRQYLNANPVETVKLFLYTPSVGIGNPADWYWIIFLKQ